MKKRARIHFKVNGAEAEHGDNKPVVLTLQKFEAGELKIQGQPDLTSHCLRNSVLI